MAEMFEQGEASPVRVGDAFRLLPLAEQSEVQALDSVERIAGLDPEVLDALRHLREGDTADVYGRRLRGTSALGTLAITTSGIPVANCLVMSAAEEALAAGVAGSVTSVVVGSLFAATVRSAARRTEPARAQRAEEDQKVVRQAVGDEPVDVMRSIRHLYISKKEGLAVRWYGADTSYSPVSARENPPGLVRRFEKVVTFAEQYKEHGVASVVVSSRLVEGGSYEHPQPVSPDVLSTRAKGAVIADGWADDMVIKMTIGEARKLVEQLKEDHPMDRLEVLAEWLVSERPGHSFVKQYQAWKGLEKPETGRKQVATALRGEVEQYFAQQYAMGTARTATARFSMNTRARADARGVTLTHAADETRRAYGDFRSGSEHIPLTAAMGANPDAFIDELLAQKDARKLLPSEVWKLEVATYYLLGQRDEPKRQRSIGPSSPVIQPKPLPTMYQGVAALPPRTSPWRSLDDRRGWVDYRRDRRDSYARKTAALLLAGLVGVGGGAVVTEIKAAKGTTDRLSDAEDTWRRMIGASLDVSLPSMREKLGDRESFGSESIGDDENGSNKVVWELDPRNGANANGYWPVEVDDYLAVSTSAGKLPPYEPLSISVQQLHQASAGFSYLPLMGYDNRASRVETQDVRIARELRVPRTLEDMSDRLLIRVTGDQLLSLGEGSALDESYVDDTGRTVRAIGLPVPVLADSDIVAINVTLRDIDSKKKLNKQVPLKVYQLRDGTFRILMRPESIPPGTYGEVEYWLDPQAKTDWKVSAQTPMGAGYYQPKDYESSINRKPENYREVINDSSFLQDVLSPEDVQGVLRALRLPAGATASQVAEAIQKYYKYSFTPYKDAHAKSDQRPYRSDNESELLPLHEILANVAVGETGLSSQVCTTAFMLGLLAGRGLNGPDNYVNAVRGYRTGNQDNTLSLGEKHMWGADDQGDIIEGTPAGEQVPSAKPEKDVSHLNPILIAEILAGAVAASAAGYGLRRGIPAGIRYGRRRRREYAEQWFEDHREQHVGDLALARHVVYMPQSGVPYDSSSQRPSSVALKASFEVGKLLGTLPRYSKAEIRDMIIANADIIVDAGINPNRLRRRLYKIRSRSQYMEKPKGQPKAKADTKRRSKK